MSQKIQFRRGTSGDRISTVFDQGEPAWDVSTKTLYIGDGATAGGVVVSGQGSSNLNPDTIVYKSGVQTISGTKTFINTVTIEDPSYLVVNNLANTVGGGNISLSNGTLSSADPVLNWNLQQLYDFDGPLSLDWNSRVLSGNWQIATASPPTGNHRSNGTKGYIALSGGYLYACTGTNLWGRVALSTF